MPSDGFARVKELLLAVADLGDAERSAYLDEACKDDPQLRREVESLLEHENDTAGMMRTGGVALTAARSDSHPDIIGPYKLLELIGEGGMGVVYLAEQTEPVRRRVALKVIKLGMDTKQVVARFEAERQTLAMMEHPNISRVFDAGATPDGRPYFVMEHVQGIPITDYSDRHNLNMRERLELFIHVCEAIQHAHQKGVIHRDLKPSNVLVEVLDDRPVPKVIDFGIAKATAQRLTERTVYTEQGQLIGTPEYMSPEQAEMTGLNVDTRTDIYSLGVLLYELLVGALPFEPETLRRAGYAEIQRILREVDPPRPSTRLSSLGADSDVVAKRRRLDRSSLLDQLRGDLDWITMKALEKDRTRRYASASEFAADIQRFLRDEPIVARPPSAAYRMRKYVKRHRVGVGFAGAAFLAAVLGIVLVSVQNARIAAARDEAELVTTTLEEMLASVDPTKSGRDVTVREVLDETVKTLQEKFKDQPLVEARLRHTVGKTYSELGESGAAGEHLQRAVEIRSQRLGVEDPATLAAMHDLAWAYMRQGRNAEAESLAQRTLEISSKVLGSEHSQTLLAMLCLGASCAEQRRFGEAQTLCREALTISRRALGEEHPVTLSAMEILGVLCFKQGRYGEAEALEYETLEIRRRALGEEHPETLRNMQNLATSYHKQGRTAEAIALIRQALPIARRVLGEAHLGTLLTMGSLAAMYNELGRYSEAEMIQRERLEIARRNLGEEHPSTLSFIESLARGYSKQGRHDEAEAILRETLDISRRAHGEIHPVTNDLRYGLACELALQGHRSEAISSLRDALDHGYRGPRNWPSIRDDPDLAALHGAPEFQAIVEELGRRNEDGEVAAVE